MSQSWSGIYLGTWPTVICYVQKRQMIWLWKKFISKLGIETKMVNSFGKKATFIMTMTIKFFHFGELELKQSRF